MTNKRTPVKKILSLGLCLLLVLTMLPAAAFAVENYTTSDEGIALIKEFEGFKSEPYLDQREWYVGYGTLCEAGEYPDGISEWEAEQLLREAVVTAEDMVNHLLMEHSISVTQYQFDALVDMTYNLGTQWMDPEYRFCSYLISGVWQYSEAEVVNAIATWCHQGTTVLENLVSRRLRDAYLFLYGMYQSSPENTYVYIHFDPNGGSIEEGRTAFYPVGYPYGQLPEPVQQGKVFQGWYTPGGSIRVTGEETARENLYVTAAWSGEGGASAPEEEIDYSSWVNPYPDVKDSDWYFSYVRELSYKGVVGGYPDGTFQASSQLKAGEALKLILLAAGYEDPGNSSPGHWAANYLALAESLGCVYPGEIPDLDSPISRLAIARVAAVALRLEGKLGPSPFSDVDDVYTLVLYEEGILNGTILNGQRLYYPNDGINRAEVCAIVSRISGWKYEEKNDPASSGYVEYGDKKLPVQQGVPAAPYNLDLFVPDGSWMYYNDANYVTATGIDVSRHNGEIDWQKVAAAGIDFAFIRLGGRLADSGEIYDDALFEANLTGAQAAGIKTGVYFYSQAISAEEAAEEARYVLTKLAGRGLQYPVVFDWEIYSKTARSANVDKTTLTDCAIAFCDTVAMAGYTPMIYIGREVGYMRLDRTRLTGYDFWFAQYASKPNMYYDYRIWQYSDKGSIPGVEGRVDMNIALIPY